jgi:adenylate cyclase
MKKESVRSPSLFDSGFAHSASMLRLLALALAGLLVYLVVAYKPQVYQAMERLAYDARIVWTQRIAAEQRVVVVDIDESSLTAIGPWPWPRDKVATLIERLHRDYHAGLIGIDMIFPEPRLGDARLRQVLQASPVVLAQVFDPAPDSNNRSGSLADLVDAQEVAPRPLLQAGGYLANHEGLLFPGVLAGHITPTLDSDGKVRRLQAVWCFQGQCSSTLALRMLMQLAGAQRVQFMADGRGGEFIRLQPESGIDIPVDTTGGLILPYRLTPDAIRYVSAANVLTGTVDPEIFANALVLVGSTALGLGDRIVTPVSPLSPGVAVHVELLTALLDDALIRPLPWADFVLLAVCLLWSLFLLWAVRQTMHPWRLLALSAGGVLLWGAGNILLWRQFSLALALWPVWLFQVFAFILLAPLETRRAWAHLGSLARQVSSYIPAQIVERMLHAPAMRSGLDAEQKAVTVLFADLRNFTTLAEQQTPERVAQLVQKVLGAWSDCVMQYGGVIEKFTGDGLLAIWGTQDADPQQAAKALAAAEAMQGALHDMQAWLQLEGFPPLAMGVGINTGPAVVGIYGSDSHRAYAAHGDAVNVGERIQRLTRETGIPLLLGEASTHLLSGVPLRHVGRYGVQGRVAQVSVWCREADWLGETERS